MWHKGESCQSRDSSDLPCPESFGICIWSSEYVRGGRSYKVQLWRPIDAYMSTPCTYSVTQTVTDISRALSCCSSLLRNIPTASHSCFAFELAFCRRAVVMSASMFSGSSNILVVMAPFRFLAGLVDDHDAIALMHGVRPLSPFQPRETALYSSRSAIPAERA